MAARSPRRLLLALVCSLSCGVTAAAAAAHFHIGLSAAAELLEITLPSSRAGVRAAYRRKAATTHPDTSTRPDAAIHFLRITTAYETLLQFSTRSTRPTAARAAAPPQPSAASHATAPHDSRPHDYGDRPDAEVFAKRVAAWRAFWMASLQAEQLATEAQRVAAQQAILSHELLALKGELDALLRQHQSVAGAQRGAHAAQLINRCRARYAQCASKHAQAHSAVQTLHARVRTMREEAARMEQAARQVVA